VPDWIATIILGIIEGITEFLPISSTGHLLLFQQLTGTVRSEFFNVGIQAGAVLAVVLIYWRKLLDLVFGFARPENRTYAAKCGVAFALTVGLGLLARKAGFRLDESDPWVIIGAVVGGGLLILLAEWKIRDAAVADSISWRVALAMGVAQVLAGVFPGTSRSAATIIVALLMGTSRVAATEFSFILGIPTMFAASAYLFLSEVRETGMPAEDWDQFWLGFVVSLVVAFLAVKWLLRFIRSHTFTPFAWYRIGLGAVLAGWLWWNGMGG
jgi:undecaprenyl-diphosphatase